MAETRQIFKKLEKVYSELPEVPCIGCGICCVTPHMTLIEFLYLLDGIKTNFTEKELKKLLSGETAKVERYPGNYECVLKNNEEKCSIHKFRSLACRLEGLPILDRMGFRDVIICPHITNDQIKQHIEEEQIREWCGEVYDLNRDLYDISTEPYWVDSLNIECWLAIALDESLEQPLFKQIRSTIVQHLDLRFLKDDYQDNTRFAEKIKLIDRFFEEAENKNAQKALKNIRQIVQSFPRTGTHYMKEGKEYFSLFKKIAKECK